MFALPAPRRRAAVSVTTLGPAPAPVPQVARITFDEGFGLTNAATVLGVTFSESGTGGFAGIQANMGGGCLFTNIPGASGGQALQDFRDRSDIRMEFASPVSRVSLLLASEPVKTWTVSAYDARGSLIDSVEVTMPAAQRAVRATIGGGGIRRVRVTQQGGGTGAVTIIDDVEFTADTAATPGPDASALLAGLFPWLG